MLIAPYEYTSPEVVLGINVAQPINPLTSIKYIPDNGENETGISDMVNWFDESQQSSKEPTIGGNVDVGVGVEVGVGVGNGQVLSTQGDPIV